MNIMLIILGALAIALCGTANIYVALNMSTREMIRRFVKSECFVGKLFTNIFYAPAWVLKGLRILILLTIK